MTTNVSWTAEERIRLMSCRSRRTFIQLSECMICGKIRHTGLTADTYMLNDSRNTLIYCSGKNSKDAAETTSAAEAAEATEAVNMDTSCSEKAKFIYISELVRFKMMPNTKTLFSSEIPLKIIRTDGSESNGNLMEGFKLGWSSTKEEIAVWVSLPDVSSSKPLILSLLFKANPHLKSLPEFQNGLKIEFEHEEMFKLEFPDYYAKIQQSIEKLNQDFF